jgi:hypothetical protein
VGRSSRKWKEDGKLVDDNVRLNSREHWVAQKDLWQEKALLKKDVSNLSSQILVICGRIKSKNEEDGSTVVSGVLWQAGCKALPVLSFQCSHKKRWKQSATKKNEILLFAGEWMELENVILSEISQAQRPKQHVFSHRWNMNPIQIQTVLWKTGHT